MPENVKVTVGIPTYNRAEWLSQTIESVLQQTLPDFQLIISDNASEDTTPEVVASFNDRRIAYKRSEHNLGPVRNLNRLIELAATEFLVLLPDDDLMYPRYLESAVDFMERFGTAGLVHTAFDVLDAQGKVVTRKRPLKPRSPEMLEARGHALERLMVSTWPLCFSSTMYRTEAITRAGGLEVGVGSFDDTLLWMRIARDWDFGYVDKPLIGFRVHEESLTTALAADEGVTRSGRDLQLLHARARFERRSGFLEESSLEPGQEKWLLALATVERLSEQGDAGPRWDRTLLQLTQVAVKSPRIVTRREFWRVALRVSSIRAWATRIRTSRLPSEGKTFSNQS